MEKCKFKVVTILIIEDNEGDVLLVREALEQDKLINKIHDVQDGESGLRFLRKQGEFADAADVDLLLLDINLPGMSGMEVLEEIRKDEVLKALPVVILTSSQTEGDILKSYQLHANCYVTKPINITQFIDVVRNLGDFWFKIVKLPKGAPHVTDR